VLLLLRCFLHLSFPSRRVPTDDQRIAYKKWLAESQSESFVDWNTRMNKDGFASLQSSFGRVFLFSMCNGEIKSSGIVVIEVCSINNWVEQFSPVECSLLLWHLWRELFMFWLQCDFTTLAGAECLKDLTVRDIKSWFHVTCHMSHVTSPRETKKFRDELKKAWRDPWRTCGRGIGIVALNMAVWPAIGEFERFDWQKGGWWDNRWAFQGKEDETQ
jgi:hypothetical protein